MKKILPCLLLMLLVVSVLCVLPTESEAAIYSDVVRLHIVAHSDSDADQALKLELRDALLDAYGDRLSAGESREQTEEAARALLPSLEAFCNDFLAARGCGYGARVLLGRATYGARDYGDMTLPAGEYTSLRILLGDAAGHNWWCLLFPDTSLGAACGAAREEPSIPVGLSAAEYDLITHSDADTRYVLKFRLLELLEQTFGR